MVYAPRGEKTALRRLRRADEAALISALTAVCAVEDAELVTFDADAQRLDSTAAIFSRASAVVGVHGGALANFIYCARGAALVEIGGRSPFATHYAHAAAALGLDYSAVAAGAGVGAAEVALTREVIAAAAEALADALLLRRSKSKSEL